MLPPAALVTDIEGTTTPIAFVHTVMFPYARAQLPAFLSAHGAQPEVEAVLADVRAIAPGVPELETLLGWMDQDAKITPLKTLQGLIWRQGFASGDLDADAAAVRLFAGSGLEMLLAQASALPGQGVLSCLGIAWEPT